MMSTEPRVSVRVPRDVLNSIDQIALDQGLSRADLTRSALTRFIAQHNDQKHTNHRQSFLTEFAQLGLEYLVAKHNPEDREKLLQLALQRTEEIHG